MSDVEVASVPESLAGRSEYIVQRVAVVLGTALASVVAFVVTNARCGAVALGPVESRSGYCRALDLPAGAQSATSLVLLALIFVLPVVVAALLGSVRWRANGEASRYLAIAICVLVASSFALIAFANYHTSGLTD